MPSSTAKLVSKVLGLVLVALLVLAVNGGDALASSPWTGMRGHSACGGVDANGNLQAPCSFKRATFEAKAVGRCPKGSFFDIGTWSCYSCPSGFHRNARSVNSPKACDKPIPPHSTRATFEGKVKCPSGSFFDPRNGGECWSCPSGYGRTAAGVDKWNACGRIGKKAVSATFRGRACTDKAAFRDPRNGGECWSCPADYHRTTSPVTGANACATNLAFAPAVKKAALTCKKGQIFDFVDGGSCWSCPPEYKRTVFFGIKTAKACRNDSMEWSLPKRQLYGIFGLGKGADDILAELIANRTEIDEAVTYAAQLAGVDTKKALSTAWDVIDHKPWESGYLMSLLQQRMMTAAEKPASQRTADEKDLLAMVAKLVQWDRQFIAHQAQQAHDTWVQANRLLYAAAEKKMGAAVVYADNTITPPNYNLILANSLQMGGGAAPFAAGTLITLFSKPLRNKILPYRGRGQALRKGGEQGGKAAARAISKDVAADVAETVSTETGEAVAEGAIEGLAEGLETGLDSTVGAGGISTSAAAAAAGPLTIAAAAAIMVTIEIDKFAKEAEAEGQIRQALAIASRPVDIGLLLQQKNGAKELQFHWSAVINAETRPSPYFIKRLAALKSGHASSSSAPAVHSATSNTTSSAGPVTTGTGSVHLSGGVHLPGPAQSSTTASASSGTAAGWAVLPGKARDIAVAADGTAWVIGMGKRSGGFAIYTRGPKAGRWTHVGGGATRIAAAGNRVFVINDKGAVFEREGNKWAPRGNPGAKDIGASNAAVYIVGGKKVSGGYQILQWKGGRKWKVDTGGGVRIDVDVKGVPWIVNDKGFIYAMTTPDRWRHFGGRGTDIAIDKAALPAVIGMNGELYVFNKRWEDERRKGIAVAMAPGGGVWYLGPKNEIFEPK